MRLSLDLLGLLTVLLQTGCVATPYYLQSVTGHLAIMHAAKPIDQWLADPQTPAALKARLALAQRLRHFAVTDLGLPDNASYQRYADLHRSSAVWNVVAAPPYSLTLKTWCFPVVGCVGYRGYFDEAQAQALATQLQSDGLEASVYGVPAYSTLGWMNWAGGDPLLNTFIRYPEGELARMLFHELAHQVLYVKGDTPFNESFATAVERLGSAAWLAQHASVEARTQYARFDARRRQFRTLTRQTRQELASIYESNEPLALGATTQEAMKLRAMERFREQYATLAAGWDADDADDARQVAWVRQRRRHCPTAVTTDGLPRPTMPPLVRWRPMTNGCPRLKCCLRARTKWVATPLFGPDFLMPCASWPHCPSPSAHRPCNG